MEKNKFTKVTIEQSNVKVTWEMPYEDLDATDFMDAIKTLMVGITFSEDQVYRAMVQYLLTNVPDKYDVIEIDEDDCRYEPI